MTTNSAPSFDTQPQQEAPKRQPWLILTYAQTAPGQITRIAMWDFATKEEMEVFYKKVLGQGTHYLVPVENFITLENIVQPVAEMPKIIKPN